MPGGEHKAPEGRTNGDINNPDEPEPRVEARPLRGAFAKTICATSHLGSTKDREACDDGVPCARLAECLAQADETIRYLEMRRSGRR